MKLQQLYLRNFRNIEELALEFGPQMNQIIGPNGQGKTSLLEALFAAMTGSSFRTTKLEELIRHGQEGFFIECTFEKEEVLHKLQLSFDGDKKRVLLNERPCNSSLQLLGKIIGVISTPEVQDLIKGPPHLRRFFLDLLLGATDPLALHHLSRMKRALKQRNALLKMKDTSTLDLWEEELAASMAEVAAKRHRVVQELAPHVTQISEELLFEPIDLVYDLKAEYSSLKDFYIQEFKRKREHEMILGTTLVGPHRDDLQIVRHRKKLSDFASEGEIRLGALAIKLAEWQVMKVRADTTPLFMIDDFAAFLDERRRSLLSHRIGALGQVFLTAHEPQEGFSERKVIHIESIVNVA